MVGQASVDERPAPKPGTLVDEGAPLGVAPRAQYGTWRREVKYVPMPRLDVWPVAADIGASPAASLTVSFSAMRGASTLSTSVRDSSITGYARTRA
jgi:hypothetical protein